MERAPAAKPDEEDTSVLHFVLVLEDEFIELLTTKALYEKRNKRNKQLTPAERTKIRNVARFYRFSTASMLRPQGQETPKSQLQGILQALQPPEPSAPRPVPRPGSPNTNTPPGEEEQE